jgi:hypothetical protein
MWKKFQSYETIANQLKKDGHLLIRRSDNVLDETQWTITKVVPGKSVHAIKDGAYMHIRLDDSLYSIVTMNNYNTTGSHPETYTEVWIDEG